jgi:IS4 transposase
LERFERHAPASVMARLALEHALPAGWVDEVFEAHRQQQYSRELLFSTVVELTTLVSLGLRPSLHAAARQMPALPVSLGSLYDKVNHTEPGILRALVRGSAERLGPVMAAVGHGAASLPGWRLRVLDGNHLPASEKRLAPLRGFRGAALPGQSLVVYDPDLGLVVDLVGCEDAHASERAAVAPLLEGARPGELWIADRHYCTRTVLGGLEDAGAGFIVREHGRHPRLAGQGEWRACGRIETGLVREQTVEVQGQAASWRRVELTLDQPTEDGDTTIRLWSNLPEAVGAQRIAELYRTRWRIEGMFGRLEAVLHSEINSLGHPRAALLGFAAAVLAYNVLALLQRAVEQAHQPPPTAPSTPPLEVSYFHLAVQVRGGYEGLLIALPPEHWPCWNGADPAGLAQHLLRLARTINPRQVATSKRVPKIAKPKGYVDGKTARTHVATARLLASGKTTP